MSYENFHQRELVTVREFTLFLLQMKSVGPTNFVEEFYGPTYHVKDFSMQFIGQFLKYLVRKDEEHDQVVFPVSVIQFHVYAVLVGTDSDTGASTLAGTGYIDYRVNGFCIYPRNKIGYIQEREMISNITSNGHSLCMEVGHIILIHLQNSGIGEVLQIIKDLVIHNKHRDRIHMISANSCNIARVICEIPLSFYAYFHSQTYPKPISFAIPAANLKSTYTLLLCQKMGLPIEKIIISCRPDSAAERFFRHGSYQMHKVDQDHPPRFIHSNLER